MYIQLFFNAELKFQVRIRVKKTGENWLLVYLKNWYGGTILFWIRIQHPKILRNHTTFKIPNFSCKLSAGFVSLTKNFGVVAQFLPQIGIQRPKLHGVHSGCIIDIFFVGLCNFWTIFKYLLAIIKFIHRKILQQIIIIEIVFITLVCYSRQKVCCNSYQWNRYATVTIT